MSESSDMAVLAEDLLADLVKGIQTAPMSGPAATTTDLRGLLSMTRRSLFATTGLVAGQREDYRTATLAICELRDEVAERIAALSDDVLNATVQLEGTLEDNVRVLRMMGSTEEQLTSLAIAVANSTQDPATARTAALFAPVGVPADENATRAETLGADAPIRHAHFDNSKQRTRRTHLWVLPSALPQEQSGWAALDWFTSEVEPIDRESDIAHDLASILCAMHERFVTSATAQQATKDLKQCATIQPRVLRSSYSRTMPEYGLGTSSLELPSRPCTRAEGTSGGIVAAARVPRQVLALPHRINGPGPTGLLIKIHEVPAPALGAASWVTYKLTRSAATASASAARPRVGAQRVLESYSDKADEIDGHGDHEGAHENPAYEVEDILGDHPEDNDPHQAPDIDEIFDDADPDNIRVGAMRYTGSMRVEPIVETPSRACSLLGNPATIPCGPTRRDNIRPTSWRTEPITGTEKGWTPMPMANAVAAIRAEEEARAEWIRAHDAQPTVVLGFSQNSCNIEGLRSVRLGSVPMDPQSRTATVLDEAARLNARLQSNLSRNLARLEHREECIHRAQQDIAEEQTRRTLVREGLISVESTTTTMDTISISSDKDGDDQPSPLVPHDWQSAELSPSESEGSPPPGYPGSPHSSEEYFTAGQRASQSDVPSFRRPGATNTGLASRSIRENNTMSSSEVTPSSVMVSAGPPADELILHAMEIIDSRNGGRSELPEFHPRNPEFMDEHRATMKLAIREAAEFYKVSKAAIEGALASDARIEHGLGGEIIRNVDGFLDTEPKLLVGRVFHPELASSGPDGDDTGALPGFRAHVLSQRIEHLSNLGCVGSRSKINYGTHVPVTLGGSAATYTSTKSTWTDFGAHEICFKNGSIIKVFTSLEEASLVASCKGDDKGAPRK
ncbi:hypothetical protein B0H17DRAFT_1137460 [Mycena rosella]|uniref:Uncharacterized protein n=1 Tax=Mycena rosella TaxID=1033263 RepID=A0AAD7D8W6_MYCRO|nr:hypothetical protein B0H17DRAFT_1137460 [Mycena rosella]